ncbi:hypothetical protein [Undibacterium sp.]|uniref:hypothetical protein n=1 Tax=Undibacterium sp. TaxID=1914977 RepID=UPI00272FCFE1|nr:hypothetical protein [Undibacterium sp.]MDP1978746.1 hypothetical protein [Undibacterium sp.]
MKTGLHLKALLPTLISVLVALALLLHGPVEQLAHYHEFADQSEWSGIPHAIDVLTNIGFALVAVLGSWFLLEKYRQGDTGVAFPAYCIFTLSLAATAVGSSYYHLAPDDARLFWDRLPIAFACCSLLAAVRAASLPGMDARKAFMELVLLLIAALTSVIWWQQTGDLRPYLLIQGLTLVLIPLWQWIWKAGLADRLTFGTAMLLYVAAKMTEMLDGQILLQLHVISGHSIKHLLAALAAGLIVYRWRAHKETQTKVHMQKIVVHRQTAS